MNRSPWQGFVLAAGLGTRLAPITSHIPKPLIPILDTPAVERIAGNLSASGAETIVVNVHHLAEMLESWSRQAQIPRLVLSRESRLMETGGGLAMAWARGLLHHLPTLVWNGDVVSNIDPSALMARYFDTGEPDALLVIHRDYRFSSLKVSDDGVIEAFGYKGRDAKAYTGICVLSPKLLEAIPLEAVSLVSVWERAISDGRSVMAVDADECLSGTRFFWEDMGTFQGLFRANRLLMQEFDPDPDGSVFISPRATVSPGLLDDMALSLSGCVVINHGVVVEEGVALRDVVVLPGAKVPSGSRITAAVVSPWGIHRFMDGGGG